MGDKPKALGDYIEKRIAEIVFSGNTAASKSVLAKLRRGIGKPPGSTPELWELTLAEFPQELIGITDKPTEGEWAAHMALTLFSLHQQSKDLKLQCMHQRGATLGKSFRRLILSPDSEGRVKRRFDAVATSQSPQELGHHLRGVIQMLRDESIPLDYSALGKDIYRFQFSVLRDGVRLQWGRDYYFTPDRPSDEKDNIHEGKE